ncbi:hypothetical protein [Pseudomonas sp. TWP3-2]|uniref:hypothetical protein n=1 Tax=Pseudomonas sp. TWP3-2 TaxID=2804574 RepID=UPI003CEABD5C
MAQVFSQCRDFLVLGVGDFADLTVNGTLYDNAEILKIEAPHLTIKTPKGSIETIHQKDVNLKLKEGPTDSTEASVWGQRTYALFKLEDPNIKLRQYQGRVCAYSRKKPTTSISVTTSGAAIVETTIYDDNSIEVSVSPQNEQHSSFPPIYISNSAPDKFEQLAALTQPQNYGREVIFY